MLRYGSRGGAVLRYWIHATVLEGVLFGQTFSDRRGSFLSSGTTVQSSPFLRTAILFVVLRGARANVAQGKSVLG